MKKIATLIVAISFFEVGFSQIDEMLYEYPWYLHSIEIDGVTYNAPSNDEVPFITAEFSETSPHFLSAICDTAEGDILSVAPFQTFRFPSGLDVTPVTCTDGDNETFEALYFNEFFLPNIDEEFEYGWYVIDSEIPTYGLDIWWGANNWAHYFDKVILNISDNQMANVAVYPNPLEEDLFLRFTTRTSFPLKVSLIDTSGRLFLSENLEQTVNRHQLGVESLPNGLYFVQIEDANGNTLTKRVVK